MPKIEIVDVDNLNTRTLTLMYYRKNGRDLLSSADMVVKHVKELWGFPVVLVINDEDKKP